MQTFLYPAIKLMHHLKYPYKFAVIGILALSAIGFMFFPLSASLRTTINVAQLELDGAQVAKPLLKLIQQMQEHRGLSTAVLSGADKIKEKRAAKEADVMKAIKDVDGIEAIYGAELKFSDDWNKAKAK